MCALGGINIVGDFVSGRARRTHPQNAPLGHHDADFVKENDGEDIFRRHGVSAAERPSKDITCCPMRLEVERESLSAREGHEHICPMETFRAEIQSCRGQNAHIYVGMCDIPFSKFVRCRKIDAGKAIKAGQP